MSFIQDVGTPLETGGLEFLRRNPLELAPEPDQRTIERGHLVRQTRQVRHREGPKLGLELAHTGHDGHDVRVVPRASSKKLGQGLLCLVEGAQQLRRRRIPEEARKRDQPPERRRVVAIQGARLRFDLVQQGLKSVTLGVDLVSVRLKLGELGNLGCGLRLQAHDLLSLAERL